VCYAEAVKSTRRASLIPWLVAAVLAHAVTLSVLRVMRPATVPVEARVAVAEPTDDAITVELQMSEPAAEPRATEPPAGAQVTGGAELSVNERGVVDGYKVTRRSEGRVLPTGARHDANPSALPEPETAQAAETPLAQDPSRQAPAPDADRPPSLSLADMGIGKPNAAALQPYLNMQPLAAAQERLDKSLAQAILDQDRDHSNGIEGPVTLALQTSAMAVVTPDSLAKVAIVIGSDGKVADFRVIETNQDARLLQEVGERLKGLIASQHVRVPSGRAVEFTYELRSEVLLPSGRSPGLEVSMFGLPVKPGRNKKSSKISILQPKIGFEPTSLPNPDKNGQLLQTPPQLVIGVTILGLDMDPVDIAAPARQVVHTRLLRQRVL
jgi:hypothetical protein